jgi:peptidoglycan hydrolase-like protein with peptidoglycan-binding domain
MLPRYTWLVVAFSWVAILPRGHAGDVPAVPTAPSSSPPRSAPRPTSDFVKSLQRELKRAGYDPGLADGKMGPATQRALKRFQEAHGLPPTGNPDIPTLTRLLAQGMPP